MTGSRLSEPLQRLELFHRLRRARTRPKLEIVRAVESASVLDRDQLREITMDDEELMREILHALLDDTALQIGYLKSALTAGDAERSRRLAHYCKGACANVGARALAGIFAEVEQRAKGLELQTCAVSIAALDKAMAQLRDEVARC